MTVTIALGGDTMLGRGVADEIAARGPYGLFDAGIRSAFAGADLRVLNLECCVSDRGHPRDAPGRPFHFRAPPAAVEVLTELGVDCVTLANNHALDYGHEALCDTLDHLRRAGIQVVGAGRNQTEARTPAVLKAGATTVAVVGLTDHPEDYAATEDAPGVAYVPLESGVPVWLTRQIQDLSARYDVVLVTPHWGPNMTTGPLPYIRAAADSLIEAGATLVAGHSAHVFHGVNGRILYDLGDLIDDYASDETLRNDLGLAFLATLTDRTTNIRAIPLALDYSHTRQANKTERTWIKNRLREACTEFTTEVTDRNGLLTISPRKNPE
jgi:poly-gamma-glutamate capsule biosynthesis protein CapA/YwtB (metallophosphatase superfamily)